MYKKNSPEYRELITYLNENNESNYNISGLEVRGLSSNESGPTVTIALLQQRTPSCHMSGPIYTTLDDITISKQDYDAAMTKASERVYEESLENANDEFSFSSSCPI